MTWVIVCLVCLIMAFVWFLREFNPAAGVPMVGFGLFFLVASLSIPVRREEVPTPKNLVFSPDGLRILAVWDNARISRAKFQEIHDLHRDEVNNVKWFQNYSFFGLPLSLSYERP